VWLIFELINISLENWSYLNLPKNIIERWAGYFIAFATVIPALIELSELFQSLLPQKNRTLLQVKTSPFLLCSLFLSGIISLVLTVVLPQYFFPLVWVSFLLILEPIHIKKDIPSLLKKIEQGDWEIFWSWVLAGITAGLIWEFLNFYSGTKWSYSIPYLDFIHVFEMPLLGYFGFIPFALEVFAVFQLYLYLREKIIPKTLIKYLWLTAAFIFDLMVFHLIDIHTSHL
jgi:hypothetical protein